MHTACLSRARTYGVCTAAGASAGDQYTGNWVEDQKQGFGKYVWVDGDVYEGDWERDMRNAEGVCTYSNGDKYSGQWKDDMRHGRGRLVWNDGNTYEGGWKNDNISPGSRGITPKTSQANSQTNSRAPSQSVSTAPSPRLEPLPAPNGPLHMRTHNMHMHTPHSPMLNHVHVVGLQSDDAGSNAGSHASMPLSIFSDVNSAVEGWFSSIEHLNPTKPASFANLQDTTLNQGTSAPKYMASAANSSASRPNPGTPNPPLPLEYVHPCLVDFFRVCVCVCVRVCECVCVGQGQSISHKLCVSVSVCDVCVCCLSVCLPVRPFVSACMYVCACACAHEQQPCICSRRHHKTESHGNSRDVSLCEKRPTKIDLIYEKRPTKIHASLLEESTRQDIITRYFNGRANGRCAPFLRHLHMPESLTLRPTKIDLICEKSPTKIDLICEKSPTKIDLICEKSQCAYPPRQW